MSDSGGSFPPSPVVPEVPEEFYTLVSKDKREFIVSNKIILQSVLFSTMLESLSDKLIPVPDVDGDVLEKIIDFCERFKGEPTYIPPKSNQTNNMPNEYSWENQFLKVSNEELTKIIHGANYLNIPRLIDACCVRLALMIRGRSIQEIRQIYKIENDFTPEEEEALRRDHIWYDCPIPAKSQPGANDGTDGK